ncbi:uncharacterized protein LOC118377556 isoform X2 [Oncorhynchus keta]|uniref:uncharacterized protein LOC118377556 isoform X2 n=1 Tax=Oncorhynchus keta TaxID=8018 RepID=UPI00227BF982|nr:uncharacterized protein LOC118377556 isoform X2 [Oncorhynchus keta]
MRSAQEFALEFRTLAAGARWSNRALIDHYRCSLREDIRRELACRDTALTFDQLVDLSIQLDNLLATCGRPDQGLVVSSSCIPSPIPMKLGKVHRETGGGYRLCTICGRRGYTAGRCRVVSSQNRGSKQSILASPQGISRFWLLGISQTEAPAVDNWSRRAEETWEAAHVHLQSAILRQKVGADRHRSEAPVFARGDRVWLSTRNLPLRLPCRKLSPRFVGPFKVLRRVNKAGGGWPASGG